MAKQVTIPETITVHLGSPTSNAKNVTVNFTDYIKNVASSEIYPTWPDDAIRANVLAQISFALNRIYTEHYRTRGYNYDITGSSSYDQAYVHNRNIFENVSQIVDEIFNNYVVKGDDLIPYFTQYCDGKISNCKGLKQWETVTLANQGKTPIEILRYFYGDDLNLVENAPIQNTPESYPGTALKLGSSGSDVIFIQVALNRISKNYPSIKTIPANTIGYFGKSTQDAVKEFQRLFNLKQDGIIGKSTWYKIVYVYHAVKKTANLDSERLSAEILQKIYSKTIKKGDISIGVRAIQYMLNVIGDYNDNISSPNVDGIFGPKTESSVLSFQKEYGLIPTGIVNDKTWNELKNAYTSTIEKIPPTQELSSRKPFPGTTLTIGSKNNDVLLIQKYLNKISSVFPSIPKVDETGYFGQNTQKSVIAFQQEFNIPITGTVGSITWGQIMDIYTDL